MLAAVAVNPVAWVVWAEALMLVALLQQPIRAVAVVQMVMAVLA
jgi:hypothetical protein